MKRVFISLVALALVLGGVGQAQASNLIVNGGFETGDFTGWTATANSYPMSIVTSPVNSGLYAAQIAGYSNNPDDLSQTVATASGQNYTLSFWREVGGGGPVTSLQVYWDATLLYSELNNGSQPYTQFSFNVAGTGSDTLLFVDANDPNFTYSSTMSR